MKRAMAAIWLCAHTLPGTAEAQDMQFALDETSETAESTVQPPPSPELSQALRAYGQARHARAAVGLQRVVEGETRGFACSDGSEQGFEELWWYDPARGAVVRYDLKWIDSPEPDFLDISYSLKHVPNDTAYIRN